jgi:hypothetical protein
MRWIKVTTLTILTLVTVSANADTLEQETTHTANRFATAEAAIARALAYTGFDLMNWKVTHARCRSPLSR